MKKKLKKKEIATWKEQTGKSAGGENHAMKIRNRKKRNMVKVQTKKSLVGKHCIMNKEHNNKKQYEESANINKHNMKRVRHVSDKI